MTNKADKFNSELQSAIGQIGNYDLEDFLGIAHSLIAALAGLAIRTGAPRDIVIEKFTRTWDKMEPIMKAHSISQEMPS